MSDIDRIISGVGGNTRYDFSTFGDPVKSYMDAQDRKAKNELRDAFKGGVPTLPDGSIDYGTMQKTLYQKGAVEQGNALMGAGVREVEGRMMDSLDGQGRAQPQAIVSPPSANRSASEVVAPPLNKGGVVQGRSSPQGDQPGSIVGLVSSAGIPDELAGPVIAQVSAMSKTDPNTALSPDMAPRIQQVVQAAAQRMKTGQAPQSTGIQPQAPPQAPPVMAQAQPAAPPQAAPQGFEPPPNVVAAQNDPILKRLSFLARSQDKSTAEAARIRLKDYLERTMPTQDQKNAAASGLSVPDYQSQGDERAAQLAILKDTVLPELKVSKEGASAASKEIQALHRAREQMDAPGGIFTSTGAPIVLKLAKVAGHFGVPSDKITNTETFKVAIGGRVLASLKALGVNPSNTDRIFAEKMAGGDIELNETSIRRILDIGEQAARDTIDRHNNTSGKFIESNEALKPYNKVMRVDAPGQYQRPKGQSAGTPSTFSSPSDVHAAIAAGKLKKGDTFQDSNGKTRVVP